MAENPRKSGNPRKSATRSDPPAAVSAKDKRGSQDQDRPAPPAALTRFTGIEALARNAGASADDLLGLLSFILCGLAGSEAWLGGAESGSPLAKLDLLVRRRDETLLRMAGQLVARVRGLNRALASGMQDFSPGVVDLLRRGAYAGGREAKYADPEDTDKARKRLTGRLEDLGSHAESLLQDLSQVGEATRVEALLHPQFLLESVRCRELEVALDQCHQRTALVVGLKTDSTRAGSEPARDLRGLLDLMEGLATPRWEPATARSRVMPLKAHVLLEAGDDDLSLMARLLPQMPGRFLWLSSDGIKHAGNRADEETAAAADLMEGFVEAAMEILRLRRAGETVSFGIADELRDTAAYDRVMARYRRWIGRLGVRHRVDPGPAAGELPGLLCFGLGFLSRKLPAGDFSAKALIAEAFRSARRLARRHCCELSLFINAERVEQQMELALRIVGNLEDKGPLSRRELARGFSEQRWERFAPVVGVLVRFGVLAWREDGKLAAGDAEILELEDRIREALLAPAPAGSGVEQTGKTKTPGKTRAQTSPVPQAEPEEKPRKQPGGKQDGKDQ
jgi:hypothetical protein